jgi:two-component system, OmpR family, sensor kinase
VSASLQRQLSLTLAGVIVAAGLAAAGGSFVAGYYEAQEFQDDALRQISALAPSATPHPEKESESRILVMRLPSDSRPEWLPAKPAPGFQTFDGEHERMRAFVRALPSGETVVVAQATNVRDELALNSALRTLVPLLLLIPLLAWLTARVVARKLAPVRGLAAGLDGQSTDRLQTLSDAGIPEEIAAFVHAINRLLERVNRLMSEQRRFVADAAHELRTPLAALQLQAQNIEGAESLQEARERLAPLRGGIERARRLTEQLLSLARAQASPAGKSTLDVASLAREIIAEYLPAARAKGVDLGMDEVESLHVDGAPETLRMILGNAIDNAIRYTPRGGEVTLRLRRDADDAVIEVIDSGPGIAAAERERVFDPFRRLDGASGEGSGLGLAIARDAAARLGGEVSLHDRDAGTGLVLRYRQKRSP